jgi:hypothetical protein
MSLKDRDMHTLAAIAACLLSAGLGGGLYAASGEAKADAARPPLEQLEAIEASIATRRKPAKLPQKKMQDAPPEPKVDKVNRDADRMPDKPPEKPPSEPKIDPTDPLKNVKRRDVPDDDTPVGPSTPDVGDPNDERGFADVTKGHPYARGIARDFHDAWEFPKISSATRAAIGCLVIAPDGKIAKTTFTSGGDPDLDQSGETALKRVETKRNTNPEPVPADLLRNATSWRICFKFNPQSRAE